MKDSYINYLLMADDDYYVHEKNII